MWFKFRIDKSTEKQVIMETYKMKLNELDSKFLAYLHQNFNETDTLKISILSAKTEISSNPVPNKRLRDSIDDARNGKLHTAKDSKDLMIQLLKTKKE